MSEQEVSDLRAALAAASPTPWKLWDGWGPLARDGLMRAVGIGPAYDAGLSTDFQSRDIKGTGADLELVVRAVNALPGLLAEVARLEGLLDTSNGFHLDVREVLKAADVPAAPFVDDHVRRLVEERDALSAQLRAHEGALRLIRTSLALPAESPDGGLDLSRRLDEVAAQGAQLAAAEETARALREALERARTYTGLEAHACPLCRYEHGRFIAPCALHAEIGRLETDVEALRSLLAEAREIVNRYAWSLEDHHNDTTKYRDLLARIAAALKPA